jgi:hypothetical protein
MNTNSFENNQNIKGNSNKPSAYNGVYYKTSLMPRGKAYMFSMIIFGIGVFLSGFCGLLYFLERRPPDLVEPGALIGLTLLLTGLGMGFRNIVTIKLLDENGTVYLEITGRNILYKIKGPFTYYLLQGSQERDIHHVVTVKNPVLHIIFHIPAEDLNLVLDEEISGILNTSAIDWPYTASFPYAKETISVTTFFAKPNLRKLKKILEGLNIYSTN